MGLAPLQTRFARPAYPLIRASISREFFQASRALLPTVCFWGDLAIPRMTSTPHPECSIEPTGVSSQLFWRTFQHPVIGALVEWVPTKWLLTLSNPEATAETDLGTWEPDPPLVGLSDLYLNMLAVGMRDPFIVGVGRVTRRVRLEAGNHRVHALLHNGVLMAPAVAYVGDSSITHLGNGAHEGPLTDLILPIATNIMGPYPVKEFRRLSSVLKTMPA